MLDEKGTVTTEGESTFASEAKTMTDSECILHRMIEWTEVEELRKIDDYLLEVHGIAPGQK